MNTQQKIGEFTEKYIGFCGDCDRGTLVTEGADGMPEPSGQCPCMEWLDQATAQLLELVNEAQAKGYDIGWLERDSGVEDDR